MRLATRTWGEDNGPLAVLVHGVSASSRTWWRVGPWFAEHGWRAVAVNLRGHGENPRPTGTLGLRDLASDLYETIFDLPSLDGRVDVLLGHSLGALTALVLCEERPSLVRRLVLEEPPGSEGADFDEAARMIEDDVAHAKETPDDQLLSEQLEENPAWAREDAVQNIASLRRCDAGPVAAMIRSLRFDLAGLAGNVQVPTLLVLGSEAQGSALPEPERSTVTKALHDGTAETFEAGHGVHREAYEEYVGLLEGWLGGSEP